MGKEIVFQSAQNSAGAYTTLYSLYCGSFTGFRTARQWTWPHFFIYRCG